jgi:hypothetical protein
MLTECKEADLPRNIINHVEWFQLSSVQTTTMHIPDLLFVYNFQIGDHTFKGLLQKQRFLILFRALFLQLTNVGKN